jgi:hypothetical protein
MVKRAFLIPFAAAISALSGNSQAAIDQTQPSKDVATSTTVPDADAANRVNALAEGDLLMPIGDDIFKFVLKRAESGELIAYHRSHESHRSHSSHRSHYSSN